MTDLKKTISDAPKLQLRAVYFAGPVVCILICWMVWIIVWGKDWKEDLQELQLHSISYVMFGLVAILAIIVVSLTRGLVSSLKVGVGALQASIDLDDEDKTDAKNPPSEI